MKPTAHSARPHTLRAAGRPVPEVRWQAVIEEYARFLKETPLPSRLGAADAPVDDVEREARSRLRRAAQDERPIGDLAACVYKVAAEATVDAVRSVKARREEARDVAGAEERRMLLEKVGRIFATLDEARRRAVRLHLQGLTTDEIAWLLGASESRTRKLLQGGLRLLGLGLEAEGIARRVNESDVRRLLRETRPSRRNTCPSGETIVRAARGSLSPLERVILADHFGACPDCAEEMRLATPLREWAERTAAGLEGRRPRALHRPGRRRFAVVLLVAAAALAMLLALYISYESLAAG